MFLSSIIEPLQNLRLLISEIRGIRRDMKKVKRNGYLNSVVDFLHQPQS